MKKSSRNIAPKVKKTYENVGSMIMLTLVCLLTSRELQKSEFGGGWWLISAKRRGEESRERVERILS